MAVQLLLLALVVMLFLTARSAIIKKLKLENLELIYRPKNSAHRWGELLLMATLLTGLFIFGYLQDRRLEPYYFIGGLGLFFAFRALMEWIYDRPSKRHSLSILNSLACLIVHFLFTYFVN